MNRSFYLELAKSGVRVPIGTDLVLRENPDHHAILFDGARLGRVIEQAARRYHSPLAIHLMDLMVEKHWMLQRLGIPDDRIEAFQFSDCPDLETLRGLIRPAPLSPRLQANVDAIAYVARNTDLVPLGMSIGPFSLTSKLLGDPITPVYLAGSGASGADDPEVRRLELLLEASLQIVLQSVERQVQAGARAIFIAEPAANKVFFSPRQITGPGDAFDRYAIQPNRQVKALLDRLGADLIFHCCGELVDSMVQRFASLNPAILSLGSSRVLWEDARLVPKHIVLYGNLPSKRFYSDQLVSVEEVRRLARDLIQRMKACEHPFILGTECDVLSVSGHEATIRRKVEAFMDCLGS